MQAARITLLLSTTAALGIGAARALVDDEILPQAATAGDGGHSVMTEAAPAALLAAFRPADCASGEAPPAELLALGDWPLDSAGTCTGQAGPAAVADATITPIRTLAEVVEADIRSPREILDSYGDTPIPAHRDTDSTPAVYGDLGPAPADASTDYGDLAPVQPSLAGNRRVPLPSPSAPVPRPLRPVQLAEAPVIDEARLDTLRGGFETPSGLRVSFGIERAVYVNGVLASVTTVKLAELGNLSGRGGAPVTLTEGATIAVIQNGPNNSFSSTGIASGALATVIQNSLDNQTVRAVTTINATVNSVEMLRSGQMMQSVRDTMVHSLMR